DTGIGIAPSMLSDVFDMFRQIDRQHSAHNRGGLGIGLALVSQLVEAHGGRIQAFSQGEGQGATFSLWLPRHAVQSGPDNQAAALSEERLAAMRILLVDDSHEVLQALGMLLELEGAQVTALSDGHEALDVAAREDFDVLVSDLGM